VLGNADLPPGCHLAAGLTATFSGADCLLTKLRQRRRSPAQGGGTQAFQTEDSKIWGMPSQASPRLVWGLTDRETLTLDPDPEMDKEEEDFNRPSHSMHRAINSVRGRAIEGIIFYPIGSDILPRFCATSRIEIYLPYATCSFII